MNKTEQAVAYYNSDEYKAKAAKREDLMHKAKTACWVSAGIFATVAGSSLALAAISGVALRLTHGFLW